LSWVTVYEVTRDNWLPVWPFVLLALAFAVGGGLTRTRLLGPSIGDDARILGACFFVGGSIMALGATSLTVACYFVMASDLRSNNVQTVEGVIRNFIPTDDSCHTSESFDVSTAHFEYSDSQITGGFNHTSKCGGGPFRSGQRARVSYVPRLGQNVIVQAAILE